MAAWARMEPTIIRNGKYKKMQPILRCLYSEAIFYCNLNETNGYLGYGDLIAIQALLVGYADIRGLASALVDKHLWEVVTDEEEPRWHIHDYDQFQPVRDEQGRWHYPTQQPPIRESTAPRPNAPNVDSRGLDPRYDPVDFDRLRQARRFA